METHKEPTENMKAALLELLHIVNTYDDGKPGLPHEVRGVHHATLKAMAKKDYGCLILLDVSNSPIGLVWSVVMTRQGLKVAKRLSKEQSSNNDTELMTNGKKRSLRTIQWQVDVNQKTGAKIYKDVKAMKEDRSQSFTRTMNTLMELHTELKAGQVGLLQKLYPEAYATMLLIAQNEIEMEREDKLGELIGEWKRLMLSQNTPIPANLPRVSDFDDDSDTLLMTVRKDAGAAKQSAQNFINSLMALNPVQVDTAPRKLDVPSFEVPEYEDDDENLFG